ncbi:MAG: type II toxin-antitoxin system PemK/MazF family toxin [Chitinophagales bacterium]
MKLIKGDIVTIQFPFTDGKVYKLRPAMVLLETSFTKSNDVLLMMITSKQKKDALNIRLNSDDLTKPLPLESYARIHKIFLLNESLIQSKISRLKKPAYDFISKRLCEIIN